MRNRVISHVRSVGFILFLLGSAFVARTLGAPSMVSSAGSESVAGYSSVRAAPAPPEHGDDRRITGPRPAFLEETWIETQQLTGMPGDSNFGLSAAIAGDAIVVGAPCWTFCASHAYLFERAESADDNWQLTQELLPSVIYFGMAVGISGDTAVVTGKVSFSGPYWTEGGGYVFEPTGSGAAPWELTAELTQSGSSLLGVSVASDADTIVVGALGVATYGVPGTVHIFARNAGGADNWGLVTLLTAPAGEPEYTFPGAVAIDGDTIVVGAPQANAAYVFQRDVINRRQWGFLEKLVPSAANAERFGTSPAIAGDTLVVGAPGTDFDGSPDQGAVYVFQRNPGDVPGWQAVQQITAGGDAGYFGFGAAVDVEDGHIYVGAPSQPDDYGLNRGAVFIFAQQPATGDWTQVAQLSGNISGALPAEFGHHVDVSGATLLVNQRFIDQGGEGVLYVFERVLLPHRVFLPSVAQ